MFFVNFLSIYDKFEFVECLCVLNCILDFNFFDKSGCICILIGWFILFYMYLVSNIDFINFDVFLVDLWWNIIVVRMMYGIYVISM